MPDQEDPIIIQVPFCRWCAESGLQHFSAEEKSKTLYECLCCRRTFHPDGRIDEKKEDG